MILPVHRTFRDLDQAQDGDVDPALILVRAGLARPTGWEELLQSMRVLIIAPAGTGKSHECQEQQKVLWQQNQAAFYLELSALAHDAVQNLLNLQEENRFNEWLASPSEIATFFLDSIDELELTQGKFRTALKRLRRAIDGQLDRVRIIVTARPIPVDQDMFRSCLPFGQGIRTETIDEPPASAERFADLMLWHGGSNEQKEQAKDPPVWRNVTLLPLSTEQVHAMACNNRIEDADRFMAEIKSQDLQDFVQRPLDVIELCADWREHGRIRGHSEQVQSNIHVKLKPRDNRKEPAQLSPARALEGSQRLALAAVLTRKLAIRYNAEADRGGLVGSTLNSDVILADWTPNERRALLQRPLFEPAGYGRLRIHHRSVMEFLAAQRLDQWTAQRHMSTKALKRMLFAVTPEGLQVVRPSLAPVAAWLAASQPAVFDEVARRSPEILLSEADPAALTAKQKTEALRAFAHHYGDGGWRGIHVPRVQVRRLACAELADCVLDLWQSGIENAEVRALLLELMGAASLTACADIAHEAAVDANASHEERLNAVEALARLGDPRFSEIRHALSSATPAWPDALTRDLLIRLFPQHIGAVDLLQILAHVSDYDRPTVGVFDWWLPQRTLDSPQLSAADLETLRRGLTDIVTDGLQHEHGIRFIGQHSYLLPMLAAVCVRLLKADDSTEETLHSTAVTLSLAKDVPDIRSSHFEALQDLVGALDARNRERLFWAEDAFCQAVHPEDDARKRVVRLMLRDGGIRLNHEQDGIWMRQALTDTARLLVERTMVLHALTHGVRDPSMEQSTHLQQLRQLVLTEPQLRDQIDAALAPRELSAEERKWQERSEERRKKRETKEAAARENWIAFWEQLARHPEAAFAPDAVDSTTWNLWQAMDHLDPRHETAGWNRAFLEQQFDKTVADQLRRSLMRRWRTDRPTLRHEREEAERNTYLIRWQLGLAGIFAESEDPSWARNLNDDEARLAVRYAPAVLNGFPHWLDALAYAHPEAVREVLRPELAAELNDSASPGQHQSPLLQDLFHGSEAVARLFLPQLSAWLHDFDVPTESDFNEVGVYLALERVVTILLEHSRADTKHVIRSLAATRLQEIQVESLRLLWLKILLHLDPEAGIDAAEEWLDGQNSTSSELAVNFFSTISGERSQHFHLDLQSSAFSPEQLYRLARLAYRHVSPRNDIQHSSVYTPTARDDAQRMRSKLLDAVIAAQGDRAWAIKLEMASDPLFANFADHIRHLAQVQAARQADAHVMNESEVIQLDNRGEGVPASADEMFRLLQDRIDDIEELLRRDTSPREAWATLTQEKLMRRSIAHELQNMANGVYTVDQEAVTADEKETDIRLRSTSSDVQGVIELKLGEKWSGRQLRDAIDHQLVRQYMAAENCRAGCLLVTVVKDRTWKHPDTNASLSAEELQEFLADEAERIAAEMGGSIHIGARILDLRPRLTVSV